jgi:acyl transferase domain-containing protein/acyl carrier protein
MADSQKPDLREQLKRAVVKIAELKSTIAKLDAKQNEPIAIVGMACRFPGADTPEEFWRVLERGEDHVRRIPDERVVGEWPQDVPRWAGVLDSVDGFDPEFFSISPREALSLDPQQRLALEVSWEALEDAGIIPGSLHGSRTGVYLGLCFLDYKDRVTEQPFQQRDAYGTIGNMASTAAGRIAYTLGMQGPTMTIDTACSSSLVTVHLACAGLREQESDLAIAGGVNLILSEQSSSGLYHIQALSPDGRCRTFDASANGFVRGEGCGMVVLERLSDAQRNGHRILAVIAGSAVNQDGRSTGLTAPNVLSQQALLRDALRRARLRAEQVTYIECHGTGTALGDPIEVDAIRAALNGTDPTAEPLWLGALKTNIGHLEAAAGIAGIIKVVLAFQHNRLPRILHLRHINPRLTLDGSRLRPLTDAVAWTRGTEPRHAGVSGFGISGTNAHVILEEPPAETNPKQAQLGRSDVPLLLSGHSEQAVRDQAMRLATHLEASDDLSLTDIGHSLVATRTHFSHRGFVVSSSVADARSQLRALQFPIHVAHTGAKLGYLFTGQGAQRPEMGRVLYEREAIFRAALDEVFKAFDGLLRKPLRDVMFAKLDSVDAKLLDQTEYTQPALFAIEVALFRLCESFGVIPQLLLGHSIGEVAAAHVAGIWSLSDACKLVSARGSLMQALPAGGTMVALTATEAEVRAVLERHPGLDIAGLNGPNAIVISGDEEPALAVEQHFKVLGREVKRLTVSHAFHSWRMEPMLAEFRAIAESLTYHPPSIPIVSNLTGALARPDELCSPDYWVRHVRHPVRFLDGVGVLEREGVNVCIELGPHAVLTAMVDACLTSDARERVMRLPTMQRHRPETETFALALGGLHCHGVPIDWSSYFEPFGPKRIPLPTYAFQRQKYWLEPKPAGAKPSPGSVEEPSFWAAIDQNDLDSLSSLLGIGEAERASLASLLPSLGSWHRLQSRRSRLSNWRYVIQWRRIEPTVARQAGVWVVAVPEPRSELVEEVLGMLEASADAVLRLDLGQSSTRQQLGDELAKLVSGRSVAGVVSLAALDTRPEPAHPELPIGLRHNLALVQVIADMGSDVRLWMLSSGAVSVGSDDELRVPAQALSWGLRRVAALEHARRGIGAIDLPATLGTTHGRALLSVLQSESDDQLALRADGWYVPRITTAPIADRQPRFHGKGTALITGGTGALGARTARWLIGRGIEHVVLTSRGGDSREHEALRSELEGLGARVSIARCDSSVREQVAGLLNALDAEGSRPSTIVHTAGVVGRHTPLSELTLSEFADVAAGKVAGALHLHELTRHYELDAFILFSSISGIWGSARQAAYSSANAYLDALAAHRKHVGLAASSIAWGPWAGGGMATSDAREQLARAGLTAMDPELAIEGLDFVGEAQPCMVIVDVDWSVLVPALASARRRPFFDEIASSDAGAQDDQLDLIAQLRPLSESEHADHVMAIVVEQTGAVLGFGKNSSIDPETGFSDLGLDSLMAVELRRRLQRVTGLSLPATLTFDYPSPIRTTRLLLDLCSAALAKLGVEEEEHDAQANDAEFDEFNEDDLLDAANALLGTN